MTRADLERILLGWRIQKRTADLQAVRDLATRLAAESARAEVTLDPWPDESEPIPEGWECRLSKLHGQRTYVLYTATWVISIRLKHNPKGRLLCDPRTWAPRHADPVGVSVTAIPALVRTVLDHGGTFDYTPTNDRPGPHFISRPLEMP